VLGAVITGFGSMEPSTTANALALETNGDIVAAGVAGKICFDGNQEQPSVFALARYSTAGSLDSTFGSKGLATTALGLSSAFIFATAVQKDGKIVAVGFGNSATIARYLAQ
jgi:hypothetical protein